MNGRARTCTLLAVLIIVPSLTVAQVAMQPTPRPPITAENEGWYLAGEPIMFAGDLYYPAGSEVYFNGNEMVRSGFYLGIPLYTRTYEEPYSRVYVALAGGLMQPYERRRAGEIAGTTGSTAPGYPVAIAGHYDVETAANLAGIPQAAAPPTYPPFAGLPATAARANVVISGRRPGASETSRFRTASKPEGLNAIFIDYDDSRWFSNGPAVLLEPSRYTRTGDYRGFAVYRQRDGAVDTIYVELATNAAGLITPYSRTR